MPKVKNPPNQLSPSQNKVWELLQKNDGKVVPHEAIKELLWPGDHHRINLRSAQNIVQVIITHLRRKLQVTITAKTNVGYCYWSK